MSQPTASKLLLELEKAVGVELFVRHARGVKPTWYGEIMVEHARKALMELSHAHDEIFAFQSGLRGRVRLGTEGTSATNLVPEAIALLKQAHPRVVVSVEMDFSEALVRRLQAGDLDIVVARLHNAQELKELVYEPIEETPHVIVARAGHPLLQLGHPVGWEELLAQSWILPPQGNVLRDKLTLLLLEQNVPLPKQVVESSYLPIIINLLRTTNMITPLAPESVESFCAAGEVAILPTPISLGLGRSGIVTRHNQKLFPAAQKMLEMLRVAVQRRNSAREAVASGTSLQPQTES